MWKIGWGLSNLCNMRCKFCYSKNVRQEGVCDSIQNGLAFIKNNSDCIESINFGTGEPSIVDGFFELCHRIKGINSMIKIGITTNGTLSQKIMDNVNNLDIFKTCIDDVDVSLDYYSKFKHDDSRGYDGAFNMAINTLELCKHYNKNATIVCALHKYNCTIENVDGLMRLARIYNATFRINIFRPTSTFDYALDYHMLKEVIMHIIKTYSVISISDPLFSWLLQTDKVIVDPTGKSSFRILPNGTISPSTYLLDEDWRGSMVSAELNISELLNSEAFSRIDKFKTPQICLECDGYSVCHCGTYDRRWLWYKSFDERDPYCPKRYNDSIWRKKNMPINTIQSSKDFVHDGYLPTLFFSPIVYKENDVWDNIYENYPQYLDSHNPSEFVIESLSNKLTPNHRILDVGSGLGRNSIWCLEQGCNVTFCDISFKANDLLQIELLSKHCPGSYQIIQGDYEHLLSKTNDSWDVILLLHVLSHGTHIQITNTINKCTSLLSDKGLILLTLPSTKDLRYVNNCKEKSFILKEGEEKGIMHSFFDKSDISNLTTIAKIIQAREVIEKEHAHWEIILQKIS